MMLLHRNCGGRIKFNAARILDIDVIPNIADSGAVFSIVKIGSKNGTTPAFYSCCGCGQDVDVTDITEVCNDCLGGFPVTEMIKIRGQAGAFCLECAKELSGEKRPLSEIMRTVDFRK